jgi:hypothetical protein
MSSVVVFGGWLGSNGDVNVDSLSGKRRRSIELNCDTQSRRTVTTPGCEKAHSPPRCRVPVSLGSNSRSDGNSCADVQHLF